MPYDFVVEDGYVLVSMRGLVTSADLFDVLRRFREMESSTGISPHRISELTKATEVRLNFADFDEYVRKLGPGKWKNRVRSALVADTPLHFGLARMFQTMAAHPQIEIAIFPNREAAVQWIRAEP